MKATLITDIKKKQNCICKIIDGVHQWIPIEGEFFYDNESFIYSEIEIEFTTNDIVSNFKSPFSSWKIEKIIMDVIIRKKEELSRSNAIDVTYKITDTKMDADGLKLLVTVYKCEYDVS